MINEVDAELLGLYLLLLTYGERTQYSSHKCGSSVIE